MTHATASRYCSRNIESPSAALKERPSRLSSNHSGRGYDPVIAVGSIRSRVTLSIDSSSAGARGSPHPKLTAPPRPAQDAAHAKDLAGLQRNGRAVASRRCATARPFRCRPARSFAWAPSCAGRGGAVNFGCGEPRAPAEEESMLKVTRDLMLPTAITGSYPRPLWFDESLDGRSFKAALGDSMFREQYLDAVACVINAQEAAG